MECPQDMTSKLHAEEILLFTCLHRSVKLFCKMHVIQCVMKISNHGSRGATGSHVATNQTPSEPT